MLIRLLIVAALIAAAVWGVQRVLGPKRLRLPLVWKSVAGRHPDVQRALDLRTAIATLLIDAPDAKFDPVLREVDGVVATLVQLARARDETRAPPSEAVSMALGELQALVEQLEREVEAQTDDQLDRLRSRLAERAGDLQQTLAARRELNE